MKNVKAKAIKAERIVEIIYASGAVQTIKIILPEHATTSATAAVVCLNEFRRKVFPEAAKWHCNNAAEDVGFTKLNEAEGFVYWTKESE